MNFCFLNNLKGFGGLEIQTILRAKDCIEKRHNAFVIVQKNTRVEDFCKKNNIPRIYLSNNIFSAIIQLSEIFKKYKIDICIAPKSNLLPLAISSKSIAKSSTKVIFYQQMQSGIKKKDFFHKWIYKNLDGAIVLTERMKQMLIETTVIKHDKVFEVPYGVEWEKYQSERKNKIENRMTLKIPQDKFVVGCIGRIEPLKGQETLLDALAMAGIEEAFLVFAGSTDDKKYFEKLQQKIYHYKIEDRVAFYNFTFDVPKLMSTFDLFVMPSLSETFGLVLLEAMSASLPVIATNSGGVPEIISNGIDGLLFETRDSFHLSKLLKKIYQDKELANILGKEALQKVKMKFDYQKNVNKFFEICELIHSRE
jgi:glycosyltransferase involved in cell wall biosynthesis